MQKLDKINGAKILFIAEEQENTIPNVSVKSLSVIK